MHPLSPLATLLSLFTAADPLQLLAAPAPQAVDEELREVTAQMLGVWKRDPFSAGRPFPAVRLVDAIDGQACPGASFPASRALLLACPERGEILLVRQMLEANRSTLGPGPGVVAFVVAYGLGQWLGTPLPAGTRGPAATPGLQAACRAGTLLGAGASGDRPLERQRIDAAIRTAAQGFDSSAAGQLGTGPQRAYAVLTGLGATSLDCSAAAMARLASGQVPIPVDLDTRGPGSLGLELSCRPPACPRRLPSGLGIGGI